MIYNDITFRRTLFCKWNPFAFIFEAYLAAAAAILKVNNKHELQLYNKQLLIKLFLKHLIVC